ncbi:MAG: sulfotransferase family protein [Fibrobacterota bacterium]
MYDSFLTYLMRRKLSRISRQNPVFIGGCGRSGTTLLLSILGAHPSLFAIPHETRAFSRWKESWFGEMVPARWRRFLLYVLWYPVQKSQTRWCEKTPMNVRHIGRIDRYFRGNFRFIHIIRDGRDVLTSRHPRNPGAYWVSLRRWVRDTSLGCEYADHPCVLTIRYEDLVGDFENTLRTICDHIGEEFSPELLDWSSQSSVKKSGAWFHGARGVHTKAQRKWERPEHAARMKEIMADPDVVGLLKKLGYLAK